MYELIVDMLKITIMCCILSKLAVVKDNQQFIINSLKIIQSNFEVAKP
jgi:hypothetical protein